MWMALQLSSSVQDGIPICASIISQRLALQSLEVGLAWIRERVQNLVKNRELPVKALAPHGEDNIKGGQGAIYLWAKLPDEFSNDYEFVRWLARKHRVVVIPGSASGGPGYIRISFGGLKEADCEVAAGRLRRGLEELVRDGCCCRCIWILTPLGNLILYCEDTDSLQPDRDSK